jgi:hypothetical protein
MDSTKKDMLKSFRQAELDWHKFKKIWEDQCCPTVGPGYNQYYRACEYTINFQHKAISVFGGIANLHKACKDAYYGEIWLNFFIDLMTNQ